MARLPAAAFVGNVAVATEHAAKTMGVSERVNGALSAIRGPLQQRPSSVRPMAMTATPPPPPLPLASRLVMRSRTPVGEWIKAALCEDGGVM